MFRITFSLLSSQNIKYSSLTVNKIMMSQPATKLLYLSTAQMDKNEFIFKDILQKMGLDH